MTSDTPCTVLVVVPDTAAGSRSTVDAILTGAGHRVRTVAGTGLADHMTDRAGDRAVDLVVVDVDPGGDADCTAPWIETVRRVLDECDVAVVLVSSDSGEDVTERVRSIPHVAWVVGDSGGNVLLEAVDNAVRRHREASGIRDVIRRKTQILDAIGEGVIVTDPDGTIRYWNRAATEMYGWQAEDVRGRNIAEVTVSDMSRTQAREVMEALGRGESWTGDFAVRRRDGSEFCALVTDSPILAADGSVEAIVGISTDITERRTAIDELARREAILTEAQEVANFGHYVFDIPGGRWTHSRQLDTIFGIGGEYPADVEGWLDLVHPDHRDGMRRYLEERVIGNGEFFDREYMIVNQRTGESRWVHGRGRLEFDASGAPVTMLGTIRDITDVRRREERLRNVVRETNHRVKNNLMMVGSLLALKQRATGDGLDFSDIRRQLEAIMQVHDLLSRGEAGGGIALSQYLAGIAGAAVSSVRSGQFRAAVEVDEIVVGADVAVPLGIVVNELATNTLKYGGRDGGTTFTVRCRRDGGVCILTVANDGPPLPEGTSLEGSGTLGLSLVNAIARQLAGTLVLRPTPYPEFVLTFPLSESR